MQASFCHLEEEPAPDQKGSSLLKWKHLVEEDTPLPTPWPKAEYQEHSLAYQAPHCGRGGRFTRRAPTTQEACTLRLRRPLAGIAWRDERSGGPRDPDLDRAGFRSPARCPAPAPARSSSATAWRERSARAWSSPASR